MSSLAGQVAVVTGASSGIGRAIARKLNAQGVTVCQVGRQPNAIVEAPNLDRQQERGQVWHYEVDLTADDKVVELASHLRRDVGEVDLLIHSAGVIALGPVATLPVAELDRQYRVNFRAPYLLTQVVLPLLRLQQAQIVFVNSSAAFFPRPGVAGYAATKSALKSLADSLREEVNPDGIRVLSVYPGRTASPMQAAVHQHEGRTYRPERLLQPDDVAESVIQALALPHSAEVTDIHLRPLEKLGNK